MKTNRMTRAALGLVAGGAIALTGLVAPAAASAATDAQKAYVTTMYQSCLGTLELTGLVPDRNTLPEVNEAVAGHFEKHRVDQTAYCTEVTDSMRQVAAAQKIKLPSAVSASDRKQLDAIAKLPRDECRAATKDPGADMVGCDFANAFTGFDLATTARQLRARNAAMKAKLSPALTNWTSANKASMEEHWVHMADMAQTANLQVPSLINTGGGAAPDSSNTPAPGVIALAMLMLGAVLGAGSLLVARTSRS